MKKTETNLVFITRIFLAVIYIVGVVGLSIPSLRPLYVQLTPVTLFISAILLFAFHEPWNLKSAVTFLIIAILGFFIEVYGVSSGIIFGTYSYSGVLGWKLLDVPLIIGVNWLILTYGAYVIASFITSKVFFRLVLGSLLMVVFDLVMEPVAIDLNMWTWQVGLPPAQNYLAWFIISIAFMSLFPVFRLKPRNPVAAHLFVYMFIFFGLLNLILS